MSREISPGSQLARCSVTVIFVRFGDIPICAGENAILRFSTLVLVLLTCAIGVARSDSLHCEVEIVLAFDVSRSVDRSEFQLMRDGTAAAFLSPDIINLIGLMPGGIMITVSQWSGAANQEQMIPWLHLTTRERIERFAASLALMEQEFGLENTAPGSALLHAEQLGRTNPIPCRRRVIDISGDGQGNSGLDAGPVADWVASQGVTINGLVILGAEPDPLHYYRTRIVRGVGSFVEVADGYEDFSRAIHRKLLRELTPILSSLMPRNAAKGANDRSLSPLGSISHRSLR